MCPSESIDTTAEARTNRLRSTTRNRGTPRRVIETIVTRNTQGSIPHGASGSAPTPHLSAPEGAIQNWSKSLRVDGALAGESGLVAESLADRVDREVKVARDANQLLAEYLLLG